MALALRRLTKVQETELLIPYAKDQYGNIIAAYTVHEAPDIITCILCDKPLCFKRSYTRKDGVFVRSHFAHHGGGGHTHNPETYYHKAAKEFVQLLGAAFFKPCRVCHHELIRHPVNATSYKLEHTVIINEQSFRIDVAAFKMDKWNREHPVAYIEIKYSNSITSAKRSALMQSGIPWFEVDAMDICRKYDDGCFFLELNPIDWFLDDRCKPCTARYQHSLRLKEDQRHRRRLQEELSNMIIKLLALKWEREDLVKNATTDERQHLPVQHIDFKVPDYDRYEIEKQIELMQRDINHERIELENTRCKLECVRAQLKQEADAKRERAAQLAREKILELSEQARAKKLEQEKAEQELLMREQAEREREFQERMDRQRAEEEELEHMRVAQLKREQDERERVEQFKRQQAEKERASQMAREQAEREVQRLLREKAARREHIKRTFKGLSCMHRFTSNITRLQIILNMCAVAIGAHIRKSKDRVSGLTSPSAAIVTQRYFCTDCFALLAAPRHFVLHKSAHWGSDPGVKYEIEFEARAKAIRNTERIFHKSMIRPYGACYSKIDKCFWLRCIANNN